MSDNVINNIKQLINHQALCVLPWHGFTLFPNGGVKNCAISNELLGNIRANPIANILDNDKSRIIRADMQKNIKHSRCKTCYRTEDLQDTHPLTKISNRIWYMKVMKNHDLSVYNQNNFANPSVLDVRWRNTCNLSCVYCAPDLSSKWAIERNKQILFRTNEDSLDLTKKWILDQIKEVKHVYLAGGEPLLIKENLELLEALKQNNPSATIRINTNLTVIDNKIFEMLVNDFPDTVWTVSIDAIGENFEYIRYPANWANFYKNLTYLYSKTQNINYNMTWSVLNAYSIFEAVDFLQTQFQCSDSVFVVQPVFEPRALRINNLSEETLCDLRSVINERMQKCSSTLYQNSLQSMLSCLNIPTKKRLSRTRQYLSLINKKRSISFPKSLSYLCEEN